GPLGRLLLRRRGLRTRHRRGGRLRRQPRRPAPGQQLSDDQVLRHPPYSLNGFRAVPGTFHMDVTLDGGGGDWNQLLTQGGAFDARGEFGAQAGVVPAPEPASWALLLAALPGLWLVRRRRGCGW